MNDKHKISAQNQESAISTRMSRRKMLAATTGAIGAGVLGRFNILRAQDANTGLLRIGLVGAGGRGAGAADQALSVSGGDVKLTAVADVFEDRLKGAVIGLSKKHGEKANVPANRQFVGFDGYQQVLQHCDFIILATPPGFRPFHFAAAVAAGKNVFMEKPTCVDAFGARLCMETAKLADSKGLKVVVGLQRHYQASYRETLKRVQDGMIGDIVTANVYWNGSGIWYRKRKPGMNEMQFQMNNWYHFCWLCGDHIVEQHVHNLDVANWFIGALPESAYGFGGRQARNPTEPSEIYDHHTVEYRYPKGIIVNSQCRQFGGGDQRVTEEFRGTKGIAKPGEIRDYKGNIVWKHDGKNDPNPYQVEHDELHAAIRSNKPINNAHYGATSSFTAVLGRYATYTGKEWKWDSALKLNHRTMPEKLDWDTPPPTLPDKDGNYELPLPGKYKLA